MPDSKALLCDAILAFRALVAYVLFSEAAKAIAIVLHTLCATAACIGQCVIA